MKKFLNKLLHRIGYTIILPFMAIAWEGTMKELWTEYMDAMNNPLNEPNGE